MWLAPPGAPSNRLAYKTGTSYGHRDAWAIGFDGKHVIGVWMGRADGTPVPGAFGADVAAPVLFQAFNRLKSALVPQPPAPAAHAGAHVRPERRAPNARAGTGPAAPLRALPDAQRHLLVAGQRAHHGVGHPSVAVADQQALSSRQAQSMQKAVGRAGLLGQMPVQRQAPSPAVVQMRAQGLGLFTDHKVDRFQSSAGTAVEHLLGKGDGTEWQQAGGPRRAGGGCGHRLDRLRACHRF